MSWTIDLDLFDLFKLRHCHFYLFTRNQDIVRMVHICQSCAMPLDKDPNGGGSNADKSISNMYCGFCYRDGKFLDEGITLQEKIEKNIQIAVTKLHIPEDEARQMAESVLPKLERWK